MKRSQPRRRGDGLSPTDPSLLAAPLEFISDDHIRKRRICALIDEIAVSAHFDQKSAQTVLRYLNEELNVQMRDKIEDLYPMLTQCCPPEDDIEEAIARIKIDQDEAAHLLPEVRAVLGHCLDAVCDPSVQDRDVLRRFASHMRRQLAAEDAILLPIASVRLTQRDLQTLSQRMRSRRGLPPVSETPNAE